MPSPNAEYSLRQLLRARLSSDDFTEARGYLELVEAAPNDVTKRALLTAAIVAYCRPFTNNDGGIGDNATSQLSVSLSKLFTGPEQDLHARLIALRNEAVAHTAYDRKPVKRIEGSLTGFSMTGDHFDLLREGIDLPLLQSMCRVLGGHCFQKMMELNQTLVEAEAAPPPKAE